VDFIMAVTMQQGKVGEGVVVVVAVAVVGFDEVV